MSAQATTRPAAAESSLSSSLTRWRYAADRSTDLAATLFIVSGVFWLLIASLLSLLTQFKLISPEFLGGWRWLSYGRVYPMAQNAFVYGWLSNAGIGITIWLWARLTRVKMRGQLLLIVSGALWNTGVALGLIGIMTGFSRGLYWLDMPIVAFAFLLPGAVLVTMAMFNTWRNCAQSNLFVSGSYLSAIALWLPLLLLTTLLPLQQGLAGATYASWYAHNLLNLWIVPVCVAAAYYLIPKIAGRAIYSYHLATPAFWLYALFACWSGAGLLIGGPAPFWVSSLSIAFSILLLVPVCIIAINLLLTMRGTSMMNHAEPAARFLFYGVLGFALFGLLQSGASLRWWNRVTQFTLFQNTQIYLGLYAFATMVVMGAIYYIVPRYTGKKWSNLAGVRLHFLTLGVGIGVFILASWFGGVAQGASLLEAETAFSDTLSPVWIWLETLAALLITVGNLLFAYLLFGNLALKRKSSA